MKSYILKVELDRHKFVCDYHTKRYSVCKELNVDTLRSHILSEKYENAVPRQKRSYHETLKKSYIEEDKKKGLIKL